MVRPSDVDEAVAEAARGQAKGLASLPELLEGALHGSGIGGTKPGAEGKRPLGRGVLADDGGIALEARLSVASVPAHEQLPLGAHQQGGEVVGAVQGREFVAEPALSSPGAPALVHQQQGGGGREGDQAHEQAEIDGVVQIEAAQETEEIGGCLGERKQQVVGKRGLGRSGEQQQGEGYAARAGGRESPVLSALLTLPLRGHAVLPFLPVADKGPSSSHPPPRPPTPQKPPVYA